MIFDHEAAILARLAAKCAPGSRLIGTFDVVDFTDTAANPVVGKLTLMRILPAGSVQGNAAATALQYSFSVYCDIHRMSQADKDAASALLTAAGNAIFGWEYRPMCTPELQPGEETGWDGRTLQLAIGFSLAEFFIDN